MRIAKKILDKNNDEMIRRFYLIDTKTHYQVAIIKTGWVGFPGGAVVETLPANAGDMGSSPGLGRSHMLRSN